jgi:hypothetical protein
MRILLGVLGVGIAIFSTFFVMFAIGDLVTGGDGKTTKGVLLGLLGFFAGTGLVGVKLMMMGFRSDTKRVPQEPELTEFEKEQRILAFAGSKAGHVTPTEVALNCRLSLKESEVTLNRLVKQGAAEVQITDDGVMVYTFPGFLLRDRNGLPTDPLI